ncbi:MAG: ECF transporter S component [Lachnospiraceae bacterium]|nr:ECF transporter S component [Candidatus Equihabitans merdae]
MSNTNNTSKTNDKKIARMAFIGMFGAIAAILMFIEVPIPFIAPPFYKMDLSELPALIGAFCMGPVAGIVIEVIKILIHLLIKGTSTAFVGELGNLVIGLALILPASIIYQIKKTRKHAIIGMAVGTLVMVICGATFNGYVLLPFYAAAFGGMEAIVAFGTAVHASVTNVLTFCALCVAPFNLIKGIIVSVLTAILYKHISGLIKRYGA